MKITLQQAIEQIDSYASPFVFSFVKADGSIREMVAVKRNHMRNRDNTAVKGSNFKYNLQEKNILLIDELAIFKTTPKQVSGVGTVHTLTEDVNVHQIRLATIPDNRRLPRSVKINTIIKFNGKEVWA